MRKVFNFNPGPAMLPEEVLLEAQAEMLDWHGTGMSIMELGHRGEEFQALAEQCEADVRELMNIPSNYQVLFLAGGGSTQFSMVPMNLLGVNKKADYVDTGIWSKKAIDEAKRYGDIHIAASLEQRDNLAYIPVQHSVIQSSVKEQSTSASPWQLREDAAYVHYTPNETIAGVEFHWIPQTGEVPLVADMTSMILSRPVNVSQFGIIYAGAQKNIGQAGLNIVIIRDDLIQEPLPLTPTLYSYKVQAENHSFYNTPPTYSWYIAGLVFAWMKRKGGAAYFYELNRRKAQKLYQFIDQHPEFYACPVHPDCRSIMNVSFNLPNDKLTHLFLEEATKAGLTNLRGHRLAGGVRASIYNAMPEQGVDKLVGFMQEFVKKHK
jgi:phosphoserine aminotransferase